MVCRVSSRERFSACPSDILQVSDMFVFRVFVLNAFVEVTSLRL